MPTSFFLTLKLPKQRQRSTKLEPCNERLLRATNIIKRVYRAFKIITGRTTYPQEQHWAQMYYIIRYTCATHSPAALCLLCRLK